MNRQKNHFKYNATSSIPSMPLTLIYKRLWLDIALIEKCNKYILYFIGLIAACLFFIYIFTRPMFYVSKIYIATQGLELPKKQQQILIDSLNKPMHFFQSFDELADAFKQISAIKDIRYQRQFNSLTDLDENYLQIILEKQQVFAKWGDDDYSYINPQGMIYQDYAMPKYNITLSGDEEKHALSKILNNQAHLINILKPFQIRKINFKYNIWQIELNEGISLTLADEPIDDLKKRIEQWQVVWTYWQKNKSEHRFAQVFDLRHPHGFSFQQTFQQNFQQNLQQTALN